MTSSLRHRIARLGTALLLSAALAGGQAAGAAGRAITGLYEGELGTMTVSTRPGARFVVELHGGAPPHRADVADCTIRAEGKLEDGQFRGRFVAVEDDTTDYSDEDARREQRKLEVRFGAREAQVTSVDLFGYCGNGARFIGTYKRR
jgi:hypothetical protein